MFLECSWHLKYTGKPSKVVEIPPYENKNTTNGICPECSVRFNQEYEEFKEKQNAVIENK